MTEPKSTDRSALVGRLRMKADIIEMGEKIAWGSDSAIMREAADFIESPQGLPENISEQLDLLVACAKPASGQNSARVAAGLVRDYIAALIRERDQAAATADRLERMANTRVDMAAYHEAKQARRADDATADRDRLALRLAEARRQIESDANELATLYAFAISNGIEECAPNSAPHERAHQFLSEPQS